MLSVPCVLPLGQQSCSKILSIIAEIAAEYFSEEKSLGKPKIKRDYNKDIRKIRGLWKLQQTLNIVELLHRLT